MLKRVMGSGGDTYTAGRQPVAIADPTVALATDIVIYINKKK